MGYRPLWLVWLLLLLLLGLTVAATQVTLGPWRLVVHLGTAVTMAGLMIAVFLGLARRDGLVRLFALGGLVWLGLLFGLSLVEVLSRS